MDSIKDILNQLKKDNEKESDEKQPSLIDTQLLETNPKKLLGNRHKYVSKEYQVYGLRLAGKLGDRERTTMYIKWAKEKPRAILEID